MSLNAQTVTWIGGSGTPTNNVLDPANWSGSLAGNGSDDVVFGSVIPANATVYVLNDIPLHSISFTSATPAYEFHGDDDGSSIVLNGNLAAIDSSSILFHEDLDIELSAAAHTASVGESATVTIDGSVYGTGGSIIKNGAGTLALNKGSYFTGGVTLDGGWLLLGNDTAAGSGTLTLNSGTLAPTAGVTLSNAIALNGSIKLGDCTTESSITFSGNITGSGAFDAHGYGNVYLNGDNSGWSGGITFMGDNSVYANSTTALGTGPVAFATYDNQSTLFLNASTTINGLSGGFYEDSEGDYGSSIKLNHNVTLTVNQASDAVYSGSLYGFTDGEGGYDGGLIKNGAGTLTLSGGNEYFGPTVINQGSVLVDGSNYGYFNSSSVSVNNGGTFGVKNSGSVNSTVTVNNGGTLVGDGFVNNAIIGAGGTLSPGFSSGNAIGTLSFEDLTLGQNGKLEFNIKYDGEGGFFNDQIFVQNSATLTINATTSNRFTLKIISLNALDQIGTLAGGITAGNNRSWLLFDTNGIYDITSGGVAITPGSFLIDDSQFSAGIAGAFSLSQTGNDIYLNFTPVPEPSTYALMALGLAGTGLAAWRKRRRA